MLLSYTTVQECADPEFRWGGIRDGRLGEGGEGQPADEAAGRRSRGPRGALVRRLAQLAPDMAQAWLAQLAPDIAQEIRAAVGDVPAEPIAHSAAEAGAEPIVHPPAPIVHPEPIVHPVAAEPIVHPPAPIVHPVAAEPVVHPTEPVVHPPPPPSSGTEILDQGQFPYCTLCAWSYCVAKSLGLKHGIGAEPRQLLTEALRHRVPHRAQWPGDLCSSMGKLLVTLPDITIELRVCGLQTRDFTRVTGI